jgi:hypothetical protein
VALYHNGAWDYGLGQKTSENSGAGTLYLSDGSAYGTFTVNVTPDGVLSGTSGAFGVTYQLTGVWFF